MGILLGLLAAAGFGASDFAAGVGGRRGAATAVAIMAQPIGLVAAAVALLVFGGDPPTAGALAWGTVGGVGGGIGALALYRGLATGRMAVVAPVSAVLAAALPAVVGLATGDSLTPLHLGGLLLALPAIALVSLQRGGGGLAGVPDGLVAGVGFGLLFVGLARAGTAAGAWPLLPAQAAAVVAVLLLGTRSARRAHAWRASAPLAVVTGVLGGLANLVYLAATGHGQLSVVAVLTALYPAVTIVLARTLLGEGWSRPQVAGLLLAAVAVALISVG